MDKKRILVIDNSIDVTGALKSILRTAEELHHFFDFHFAIPTASKSRLTITKMGFTHIYELPMKEISKRTISLTLYIPFLILNALRLKKIIKKEKISIIHLNDLYNLLPVVVRLFGTTIPYVCHIRFLPDRFPPWLLNFWMRLHLKYASQIVAVSKSVADMLPSHPKIVVVHNELPSQERYPELTTLSDRKPSFTFLYLSNYIRGKGQDFALEAFARVHQETPLWRLRFIGSDMGLRKNQKYRDWLMERAKVLGIEKKIDWFGFTEDVEKAYKHADIVLNFSESESFSITCVEALYFSRPVIATKCGGPSEIIDDNETGILVPNRDINAMANAMLLLATNYQLRKEYSDHAGVSVRSKFSFNQTSNKLYNIYTEIM